VFAQHGFRPVFASVAKKFVKTFPRPARLFTVNLFGGWTIANKVVFDPTTGIVVKADRP